VASEAIAAELGGLPATARRTITHDNGGEFARHRPGARAPTTNGSERALRPCATFRKVTGGFRTSGGPAFYADIRSLLETARRRGIPPLRAIALTLNGCPLTLQSA
jgi:hypothetical protein